MTAASTLGRQITTRDKSPPWIWCIDASNHRFNIDRQARVTRVKSRAVVIDVYILLAGT